MARVKPTPIVTPRIVQPGDRSRPWLWVLFLVALAAWSWQVYQFGQQRAGFDASKRDHVEIALRERIEELETERKQLRTSAARLERSGQIDRAAANGVQSQVKALQDERADLKREVAFLKTLVSGSSEKLVLDSQNLTELGERRFRFEVTLTKQTEDSKTVNGQVEFSVLGELSGESKKIDMKTLTKGKRSNIGIRFKNFQKLKAELELPEGFVPTSIEVAVKPDSRGFKSFAQTYDWKLSDA